MPNASIVVLAACVWHMCSSIGHAVPIQGEINSSEVVLMRRNFFSFSTRWYCCLGPSRFGWDATARIRMLGAHHG